VISGSGGGGGGGVVKDVIEVGIGKREKRKAKTNGEK